MPFISGSLPDKPLPYWSQLDAPFPLEALLAPDRDAALRDWSAVRPRRPAAPVAPIAPKARRSATDQIMNYLRLLNAQDADRSRAPSFVTDAVSMPLVPSNDAISTGAEDDVDDPRQDRASIRWLTRLQML